MRRKTCDICDEIQGLWGRIYWRTGNLLRQRVTTHNQQIRDHSTRMLKASKHISNCANAMTPKYEIFPFYKMYSENTTLRRAKETIYIYTFCNNLPMLKTNH